MVNWQLSKQGIRWPVSHDRIADSGLELIEVTYFLKFTTDQVIDFHKLWKQVKNSKLFFWGLAKSIYYTSQIAHIHKLTAIRGN